MTSVLSPPPHATHATPSAIDAPLGIWLDPVEPQVAVREQRDGKWETELLAASDDAIPPAVLAPRFSGEPVRVDRQWPPHPRGCGDRWPPEARVEEGRPSGRLPIAYAWSMLLGQRAAGLEPWRWRHAEGQSSLRPAAALAHALADFAQPWRPNVGDPPAAVVVPDGMGEHARHALLLELRRLRMPARLMWRSVAAAMAWCDAWADQLDPPSNLRDATSNTPGSVLHLHLGSTAWQFTVIDLVWRSTAEGVSLVPWRRAAAAPGIASFGLELLHRIARRSLQMSYQQPTAGRVWELVWCTPWLGRVIDLLSEPTPKSPGGPDDGIPPLHNLSPHVRAREFLRQQWRQGMQQLFGPSREDTGMVKDHLPPTPTLDRIRDWFATQRKALGDRTRVGAVVTGPMARILVDGEPLGLRYLREVWPKPMNMLLAGQSGTPVGLLAQAAAEHAQRMRASRSGQGVSTPHFLDTLPRIRIAAVRGGKLVWIDLMDDHDQPMPGGRRWHRFERITGLTVRPGRASLTLALWHADFDTVHTVAARLPQRATQPTPYALSVNLDPGQGHPRIEAMPLEGAGTGPATVDWQTLRDTGLSPDAYRERAEGGKR